MTTEPKRRRGSRLVVGLMSGTSLDGLDGALVRIHGTGLRQRAELVAFASLGFGPLAVPLRALAEQQPMSAGTIAHLSRDFSRRHVAVIRKLMKTSGLTPDLVCAHGQTVFHQPPVTWQLLTPAVIAHELAVPVVSDLRAMDVAAGGQGAPITPIADLVLYGHQSERRTVVNLGGFCNITRLPSGRTFADISGGDVCACNQVLDAVARAALGRPYDPDGRNAAAGHRDPTATTALLHLLTRQRRAKRSLGTGDELAGWISDHGHLPAPTLARSACAAIAMVIAAACAGADRLIIAGGGVRNRALMAELRAAAGIPVDDSADHGWPAQAREAVAFAVLGALCADGVLITLPAVTKVKTAPLSGTWCGR
jgi:anhydro-N-acetylmuramic acid kinase